MCSRSDIAKNKNPQTIFYRSINVSAVNDVNRTADINRTKDEITNAFASVQSISLTNILIATWDNVSVDCGGTCEPKANTFQVVIATDGIQSYVLFLYVSLTWFLPGQITGQSGFLIIKGVPKGLFFQTLSFKIVRSSLYLTYTC